jgi:hypothetical protein
MISQADVIACASPDFARWIFRPGVICFTLGRLIHDHKNQRQKATVLNET